MQAEMRPKREPRFFGLGGATGLGGAMGTFRRR